MTVKLPDQRAIRVSDERIACAPDTNEKLLRLENHIISMRLHVDAVESENRRLRRDMDLMRESHRDEVHDAVNKTQSIMAKGQIELCEEMLRLRALLAQVSGHIHRLGLADGDDALAALLVEVDTTIFAHPNRQ